MANNALTNLQRDFLREFFRREHHFFLTGGAALVGFYLGHRETNDLDLFTLENEIENGFAIACAVAGQMNASLESIQTAPDFRRLLIRRGDEAVVLDLVRIMFFKSKRRNPSSTGFGLIRPQRFWQTNSVRCCRARRFVIWLTCASLKKRGLILKLLCRSPLKKIRA